MRVEPVLTSCIRADGHSGPCNGWPRPACLAGSTYLAVPKVPWYEWSYILSWLHDLRVNPKIVDKTPLLTTLLFESANVGQLWRMWTQSTAAGQSLWAWICVNIAMWLWLNFYLVFNRENKFAIWCTSFGILLNSFVVFTVFYFRYLV